MDDGKNIGGGNMINEDELNRRTVKRILLVLISGIIFILIDISSGSDMHSVLTSSSGGALCVTRPAECETSDSVHISAEIESSGKTFRHDYDVAISPYSGGRINDMENSKASGRSVKKNLGNDSKDELFAYELRGMINSLNDDTSRRRIMLPSELSSGEKIRWTVEPQTNTSLIVFAMMMLIILIYKSRMAPLKKLHETQQESVLRQLPEFVNRLVLLLNAGMVLNSAFEKTIEEGFLKSDAKNKEYDFFYTNMCNIYSRLKQTNGSLGKEFRSFAHSGKRIGGDAANDLIRISNILNDNISKGVELTEKLQSESEILWLDRKRSCEERGRLAETKLTLPLTLFLLVLIVITVSPALLEL